MQIRERHFYDTLDDEEGSEIEVRVTYAYEPEEAPVYYPNDAAHPGAPASAEIVAVWFHDVDLLETLPPSIIEQFEQRALEEGWEE